MAANAGVPPEGWSSSEVQRLRSAGGSTSSRFNQAYDPKFEEYYEDRTRTYLDESGNTVVEDYSTPDAPARLTDIPTSSLNVSRPRTVAAGYDESRQIMTVVFRDGTVYNYYEVSPDEWIGFHNSVSKGRPWLNTGLFTTKPQGPADMSGVSERVAKDIYSVSALAQVRYATKRKFRTSAGSGKTTLAPRTVKNVHNRSKLSPNSKSAKGRKS
jgi:hypothetical protein